MFKKYNLIFFSIILFFVFTRLLGIGQIYHQDEYRWATIANPVFGEKTGPHPPFTLLTLKAVGHVFGFNLLRLAPFLFSAASLFLIFLVSIKMTGSKTTAFLSSALFGVSVYGAISNLQVDIDGSFLPFFVLLSYYAYLNFLESDKSIWRLIFGLAVLGGLLTKLSFVIFLAAVFADYFVNYCPSLGKQSLKKNIKKVFIFGAILAVLGASFYVFLNFYFKEILEYGSGFRTGFDSRSYFEMAFKIIKSFIWLSPLLLLPVLYGVFKKEILWKYKFWFIYLGLNLLFYIILFDFTRLTIERYFMFWIVPSVLISADVLVHLLGIQTKKLNYKIILIAVILFILFSLIIIYQNHDILPLNPKVNYVNYVESLNFNFLVPFSGGSGPIGFYFSAKFILLSWLISVSLLIAGLVWRKHAGTLVLVFLVFGVGYNLLLMQEYLLGKIFGSPAKIARQTVDYAVRNDKVRDIVTYYDTGAYDLRLNGKYLSRFYTAPLRDYTQKLKMHQGFFMVVDFPSIDKKGVYWPLVERCNEFKRFSDKNVQAYLFDCTTDQ